MELLNKIYNPREIQNKSGRIYYYDNLKFILIFLVVFGHFISPFVEKSHIAKSLWIFIWSFHMPLFIFISGYLAKNSIVKRDKNKIFNFLILYVLLKFIIFIIQALYDLEPKLSLFKVSDIPWYLMAMAVWYVMSMLTQKLDKNKVFVISIILALIIGYDKDFRDILALSRILVYYPFFLLGTMIGKDKIHKLTSNKLYKFISIIILFGFIAICLIFTDKIYFIRPLLTGRNSYYSLNNNIEYFGLIFRIVSYILAVIISVSVMTLVPKGKTFFSNLGSRTLAVYFLHAMAIEIFEQENIGLHVYQCFILSLIATFIFSLKWFSIPFNKILKLNLYKKEGLNCT